MANLVTQLLSLFQGSSLQIVLTQERPVKVCSELVFARDTKVVTLLIQKSPSGICLDDVLCLDVDHGSRSHSFLLLQHT